MKINKNSIIRLLLFVFTIVIVGQFVLLHTMSKNVTKIKNNLGNINVTKAMVEYRQCELQCIGKQISDSLKLVTYESAIPAKDVLGGRKTLVYYFSQVYCKMCIESQIEAIKAVFNNDSTNIVLLANSTNYRELYVLRKTHNLKCPIYRIDKPLNLPADTMRMPYFLLVDENIKVSNCFITLKERMNYSIHYLKSMYSYFNSCDNAVDSAGIIIFPKRIDLGKIKNGTTKNIQFTITNNSEQNVQIEVVPDCDCTTIELESRILQAREKKRIAATIKFDSEGEFVKYIYVYCNDTQNPIEVEIRGHVK